MLAPARILRNDGAGRFTDESARLLPPNAGFGVTKTADFDGDGALDICTGDRLLVGRNGQFVDVTAQRGLAPLPNPITTLVAFDADGDLDAFVGHDGSVDDELFVNRHRHLALGPAALGKPLAIDALANPGYDTGWRFVVVMLGLAARQPPQALPPFGTLVVDPRRVVCLNAQPLPPAVGSVRVDVMVPADALLVGRSADAQAIVFHALAPDPLVRLSALASRTIER